MRLLRVIRGIIKDESGQSLVELCVMIPFVLFLIMSIISVSMLMYTQFLVTFASGQGVDRAAEIWGDETKTYAQKVQEVEEVVDAYMSNGVDGTDNNVIINIDDDKIEVTVEYEYKLIFAFTDEIFGHKTSVDVSSVSVDFIE